MKESIGYSQTINIVIIFIFISFAFVGGILTYTKAHKVNSEIAKIIESYEGNIAQAEPEINRVLSGLGYLRTTDLDCPTIDGKELDETVDQFDICLYYYNDTESNPSEKGVGMYYYYQIRTYLTLDMPLLRDIIKIPVNSKTEKMFNFSEEIPNKKPVIKIPNFTKVCGHYDSDSEVYRWNAPTNIFISDVATSGVNYIRKRTCYKDGVVTSTTGWYDHTKPAASPGEVDKCIYQIKLVEESVESNSIKLELRTDQDEKIICCDASNKCSVTGEIKDVFPPKVSIAFKKSDGSMYEAGSWTNKNIYISSINVTDNKGVKYWYYNRTDKTGNFTTTGSGTNSASYFTESNKITFSAEDINENTLKSDYEVNIDKVNPTFSISKYPDKVKVILKDTGGSGVDYDKSKYYIHSGTTKNISNSISNPSSWSGTKLTKESTDISIDQNDKDKHIVIAVYDNAGNVYVSATKLSVSVCDIGVSPSGWSFSKTVKCNYIPGYTNQYKQGNGSWTTYTSNVSIPVTTNDQYIYFRLLNESAEVASRSIKVTEIDRTAPSSASVSITVGNDKITAVASGKDNESGINSYRFQLDEGSWSEWQTSNTKDYPVTSGKKYTVKVQVANNTRPNEDVKNCSNSNPCNVKEASNTVDTSPPTLTEMCIEFKDGAVHFTHTSIGTGTRTLEKKRACYTTTSTKITDDSTKGNWYSGGVTLPAGAAYCDYDFRVKYDNGSASNIITDVRITILEGKNVCKSK